MFRIIKDFVPKPILQITCDRACGYNGTVEVEPGIEMDMRVHAQFISQLAQQGWRINLAEQVCPKHVEHEAANAPRIIQPYDFVPTRPIEGVHKSYVGPNNGSKIS